jgi:hypothetical protein
MAYVASFAAGTQIWWDAAMSLFGESPSLVESDRVLCGGSQYLYRLTRRFEVDRNFRTMTQNCIDE